MCIAIARRAGVTLSYETLRNSYEANRDGCGVAYVDETGTIQIFKSLVFSDFLVRYREIEEQYMNSDMLIHFRIKTHGKVDLDNCHPFVINDDMVMMHNGTISNVPTDKDKSDTRMFVEHYLQHLKDGWEDSDAVRQSIEAMIGWSKIVVLHRTKGLIIYNEDKGTWEEDAWYSNQSHKKYVPPAQYDQYSKRTSTTTTTVPVDKREKCCDWVVDLPTVVLSTTPNLPAIIPESDLARLQLESGTIIYRKCIGCGEFVDSDRLFTDPLSADIEDHYCIKCAEYIYAPYSVVINNVEKLTFYEYLIDCELFTDDEITQYLERFEALEEELTKQGVDTNTLYNVA